MTLRTTTEQSQAAMQCAVDLDQARAYLRALDAQAQSWCFQTFDDGSGKRQALAHTLHGSLDDLAPRLAELNSRGAGVFVTVNEVPRGKPRKADKVTRVRAVFADFDDGERDNDAAIKAADLPPSIIVQSSPSKRHAYWLTDDVALSDFTPMQAAIIAKLGSDKAIKDLSRVMRLPGFWHRKGAPQKVQLLTTASVGYSAAQLAEAFAPAPAAPPAPATPAVSLQAPTAPVVLQPAALDAYALAALENAAYAVSVAGRGERNQTLNASAYGLARLVAAQRLSWQQCADRLTHAALTAGLVPGEIRATLQSALKAGSTNPNMQGLQADGQRDFSGWKIDNLTGELREPEPPKQHPLACIVDACEQLQAPRWLLPGFMAEGLTLIAGGHGVGKTTALLPLACAVAGIHEHGWPLAPKHWREVIYVTEDIPQAQRILAGLAGHLATTTATIADRLRLVDARRLSADYLVQVGKTYRERYTRTVEGVELLPLVVLDTQAATIALENENDNSEASAAVAELKQHFEGLPVWLVAHLAKANLNRQDAQNLSARGASAWEADANCTAFLVKEGDGASASRWLVLGKRRFEPRWPELQLESHHTEATGYDAWGEPEPLTLRWAIASPRDGTRAEQTAKAKEAQALQDEAELRQEIRDAVQIAWQQGHPLNRAGVRASVKRKGADVVACIERLLGEGWLVEIHVPVKLRKHPRQSDFLVNLDTPEREATRRGEPLPEGKTVIPESWMKPVSIVPENEAENAPEGASEAA